MGQSAGSIGGRQSKDELLYQYATTGNIEAIKALCREGASLEVLCNHNNGAISLRFVFCFILCFVLLLRKSRERRIWGLPLLNSAELRVFLRFMFCRNDEEVMLYDF